MKLTVQRLRNTLKPTWQRLDNREGVSIPVFLVGCGRSGTNFLVSRLDKLWQVQLYNENHPAAFEKWRLRNVDVINQLIIRSPAKAVVFKPINDGYRMRQLLDTFPSGRVILQFRHYEDVVNSIVRGPFGSRKGLIKGWLDTGFAEFRKCPPSHETQQLIRELYSDHLDDESGSALYWLTQNRLLLDQQLDEDSRVLPIRYESLVHDPEPTFAHICEFIGVRYVRRALRGLSAAHIGKRARPNIIEQIRLACDDTWQRLVASEEETTLAIAKPVREAA